MGRSVISRRITNLASGGDLSGLHAATAVVEGTYRLQPVTPMNMIWCSRSRAFSAESPWIFRRNRYCWTASTRLQSIAWFGHPCRRSAALCA